MRYSGSKLHFVDKFNEIIKKQKEQIFIEPFIGSGAIFLNLQKDFEQYIINDLDENIISIWNAVKEFKYKDFLDRKNFVFNKFGNIKDYKKSFYNFRNWYNENYHFSDKKEKGIYLYFLANSCINSFLRFGKEGMNQSYGNRFYIFDNHIFNLIKNKLHRTIIKNKSYLDLDYNNSLIFLDPPYMMNPSSYSNGMNQDDYKIFIDFINQIKINNKIIYTDTYNDILKNKLKDFHVRDLRQMKNTSPNRKNESVVREVYLTNIKIKKENKIF